MAFLAPLIGMGASLLGGLFGNKQQQQQQQTQTTTPNLTPLQQNLMNSIIGSAQSQMSSVPQDLSGYASNAIYGNNQTGQSQQNALQRALVSRGLQSSPMATSEQANLRMQTANQNQQVINQLPLLRTQLLQNALGSASSAFRALPFGQTQTGNLQGNQAQNMPLGSALGQGLGIFGSIGAAQPGGLGGLFSGLFGGNRASNMGISGIPTNYGTPSSANMVTSMGLPQAQSPYQQNAYNGDLQYG